jgi:uncharacterized damage-inducible protein DinB
VNVAEVLTDGLGRVQESVHEVLDGLGESELTYRADPEANTIAWLIWHLTRVEDDHVADVAGHEQAWTAQGWMGRFELPFPPSAHGYGQTAAQVGAVRTPAELLAGYHDAVHDQALEYISHLSDDDLDRDVDKRWDPPVTLGVRLVSVVNDCTQHVGQAAFIRGIVLRA